MALEIPTVKDLANKIKQSFNANLTGADATILQNFLFVTSKVFSLALKPLYYLVDWVLKQSFATTADEEYLILLGNERGVSRLPATKAKGYVKVTATAGQTIATNAMMTTSDAKQYKVLSGITTVSGVNDVLIESINTGSIQNLLGGTKLTLSTPNPNITNIEVANTAIAGGSDLESIDSLRSRILTKKRTFDISGTIGYFDYFLKQEVAGITRIFTENGIGTFKIYIMMDDKYSNGIPLSQDITNAQTVLDEQKVLGTAPVALAPIAQSIDVFLTVYESITSETDLEIRQELTETIRQEGRVSTLQSPFFFAKENLDSAVSRALQSGNFVITSPNTNITIENGKVPVIGSINISIEV